MVTHFEKWAEDKPLILVFMARQIATCADAIHDYLWMTRDGELPEWMKLDYPIAEWLSLYENPERIKGVIMKAMSKEIRYYGTNVLDLDKFIEVVRILAAMPPEDRLVLINGVFASMTQKELEDIMKKALNKCRIIYYRIINDYKAELEGKNPRSIDFDRAFKSIEFAFYMKVVVRCQLEYGVPIQTLIDGVECGEVDAIEKLLRLDKKAFFLTAVQKVWTDAHNNRLKLTIEQLNEANGNPPNERLNMGNVKAMLGAFLHLLARSIDKSLRIPVIMALFDAVAKDHNQSRDTDLDSLPAFKKAVQRAEECFRHWFPRKDDSRDKDKNSTVPVEAMALAYSRRHEEKTKTTEECRV